MESMQLCVWVGYYGLDGWIKATTVEIRVRNDSEEVRLAVELDVICERERLKREWSD